MFRRVFVAWKNNWTAHGMYMKCNKVVACMNTGNKNCKCTKKWIRMCIVRLGTSNILCFYSKHMFKFKAGNQWSWNNKLRESAVYFVVSSSTRNIIQRMNDKAQMLFYRLHLLYIFWCDFVFFFLLQIVWLGSILPISIVCNNKFIKDDPLPSVGTFTVGMSNQLELK